MRGHFEKQLEELNRELIEMGNKTVKNKLKILI